MCFQYRLFWRKYLAGCFKILSIIEAVTDMNPLVVKLKQAVWSYASVSHPLYHENLYEMQRYCGPDGLFGLLPNIEKMHELLKIM